jgi:hypothetical protein
MIDHRSHGRSISGFVEKNVFSGSIDCPNGTGVRKPGGAPFAEPVKNPGKRRRRSKLPQEYLTAELRSQFRTSASSCFHSLR